MKSFVYQKWIVGTMGVALMAGTVLGVAGCQSQNESPSKAQSESADTSITTPVVPTGSEKSISSLTETLIDKTVTVRGEIVQQCPAIGCWIRVKDDTGELFVDLKPGSLELSEKRVGQQARVSGRLVKQGGQLQLEAEHLEFVPEGPDSNSPEK